MNALAAPRHARLTPASTLAGWALLAMDGATWALPQKDLQSV